VAKYGHDQRKGKGIGATWTKIFFEKNGPKLSYFK
jgi:hypothetical protein